LERVLHISRSICSLTVRLQIVNHCTHVVFSLINFQ